MTKDTLPTSAQVVIVGGGIIGCSVAYHLARALALRSGLTRTQTTDQRNHLACRWTSGTTSPSQNMTRLAKYSTELFGTLESMTGQATGYQQTGSITLHSMGNARRSCAGRQPWQCLDVVCEWVEPDFIADKWPGIRSLTRGRGLPAGDGQTNQSIPPLRLRKGQAGRRAHHREQRSHRVGPR